MGKVGRSCRDFGEKIGEGGEGGEKVGGRYGKCMEGVWKVLRKACRGRYGNGIIELWNKSGEGVR